MNSIIYQAEIEKGHTQIVLTKESNGWAIFFCEIETNPKLLHWEVESRSLAIEKAVDMVREMRVHK